MPNYEWVCDSDSGGCGSISGEWVSIADYDDYFPVCKNCHKTEFMTRDFSSVTITGSVPKTVGSLIDKNNVRISEDEKNHLLKKTRTNDKK